MIKIYIMTITILLVITIIFLNYFYKMEEHHILDINDYYNNYNDYKLTNEFNKKILKFNKITKPSKMITKYQTFYDISVYPQLKNINYLTIKNELVDFVKTDNNNWIEWPEYNLWKKNIQASWKIIPLMAFGKWSEKKTKFFPKTTSLLKKINGLVSAGFSNIGPNTTLELHKGWGDLSNNILRCHLGLIIPKSKCKVFVIGVSNDYMEQKNGNWIIFDDSLYHSASNEDTNNERIILLLDIIRPNHIPKGESDIKFSEELNNFIEEFNK